LPTLLIHTLGKQTIVGTPWPSILVVVAGTLILSAAVLVSLRRFRTINDATFTSIFQGGVRFNTYITLAVAQILLGIRGLAMASIAAGFMIVLINLLCVSAFVLWGKATFKGIFPSFVK